MSLRLRSGLAPSLGDQYERLAKRRQEQQAEEARVVARRRAEEALDVANINRFSEAELETVLSSITVGPPTPPQRSIFPNAQNVAVELSAERPERPFRSGIESETSARDAMHASPIAENYADVDFDEPNVASDPEIQQLLHELSEVKESHKTLERQLEQHKKEVLNLRKELRITEERRIQNPCDATTTQEYKDLREMLRDCQTERDDLQNELDKLQERERELCQELHAARLRISNQTNEIVHLNERSRSLDGQLADARIERDMHARTVEALQHQLEDLRRRGTGQDAQAEVIVGLSRRLDWAIQDLDRFTNNATRCEGNLGELQGEVERVRRQGELSDVAESCSNTRNADHRRRILDDEIRVEFRKGKGAWVKQVRR